MTSGTGYLWAEEYMWHDTGNMLGWYPAGIRRVHIMLPLPFPSAASPETCVI
jgi:hypothetical protein